MDHFSTNKKKKGHLLIGKKYFILKKIYFMYKENEEAYRITSKGIIYKKTTTL